MMNGRVEMQLEVRFTSDWHVGSGTGRPGDVDHLVVRDRDGLPYVPARTLLGLWREAAEALAQAIDRATDSDLWTKWVTWVFGSQPAQGETGERRPVPSRIRLEPARFEPELAQRLVRVPAWREALTTRVPGVRIDPYTGTAMEDDLVFVEVVRAGAVLSSTVTVTDVPESVQQFVRTFLAATFAGIRWLGSKGRRGKGRCCCRVVPRAWELKEEDPVAHLFRTYARSGPPDPPDRTCLQHTNRLGQVVEENSSGDRHGQWQVWSVLLALQEPLVLHARTLGNVVESLDYVPGTVLFAVVARELRRQGIDVSSAINAGDILIRNAYVEVAGERGLPVPLCLYAEKYGHRLASTIMRGGETDAATDVSQWKALRGCYVPSRPDPNGVLRAVTIPLVIRTHNVISDEEQRPTPEVGGLFSYEACPPDLRMVAHVLARGAVAPAVERVLRAIEGRELHLGSGKRADYGKVRVERCKAIPVPTAGSMRGDELVLWVVSPMLARSPSGLPSVEPRAVQAHLASLLGVEQVTFVGERSCVRHVRLDSWQEGWSLPRPSLVGIGPGSVLVFKIGQDPSAQGLSALACKGLGERCAEGMGEVVVNREWLEQPPNTVEVVSPTSIARPIDMASPPTEHEVRRLLESDFGRAILLSAARQEVLRLVMRSGVPECFLREDGVSSQLGALRTLVVSSHTDEALVRAGEWVQRGAKRGRSVADVSREVESLLTGSGLWQRLGCTTEPQPWFMLDERLKERLHGEALRFLLVHWCRTAQRGRVMSPGTQTGLEEGEADHGA